MSSEEIAEVTEKEHKNVIRDIRVMLDAVLPGWEEDGSVLSHQGITITYDNRKYVSEIRLPKDLTITLVAGYDANLRLKIIRRWMELEGAAKQPAAPQLPDFTNPVAAARAWADATEAKQIAEQRALTAEKTKAEIGARREATAMNTASQAVKRANKLQIELDRALSYASIKRMQEVYKDREFNWRVLKQVALDMGLPPVPVPDQNYGKVNAYHAEVWKQAYDVAIPRFDKVA